MFLASQVEDLLDAFGAFKTYKRRGLDAQLAFFRSADLPPDLRDWVFQLCRTNMKVGALSAQLLRSRAVRSAAHRPRLVQCSSSVVFDHYIELKVMSRVPQGLAF